MFTLVQYLFGTNTTVPKNHNPIGKSDENTDPNNDCQQSNIENDWILIEVNENEKNPRKTTKKIRKLKEKSSSQVESQDEESWSVEPPECFKNTNNAAPVAAVSASAAAPKALEVKSSSLENLLIEHPNMSVFSNLVVVKRSASSGKIAQCAKKNIGKMGKKNNNNENVPSSRPLKKKLPEACVDANLKASTIATVAATAIEVANSVNQSTKKRTTKKGFERQNKATIQRNGPINRHKKMFTHPNGVYYNRNNC